MYKNFKLRITIFHCINTFNGAMAMPRGEDDDIELNLIKLPCSSMVKDVFLLRAFEAGADAVIVLVCPEGACRYVEGNLRAKRRVQRVQNVLDEIGLGSRRLSLFNVDPGDEAAVAGIIQEMRAEITALGPNPAHYISRLA
jgi:coenzyme F420-reducing hydrogenase delta subunit